jgi:hypothetical protein
MQKWILVVFVAALRENGIHTNAERALAIWRGSSWRHFPCEGNNRYQREFRNGGWALVGNCHREQVANKGLTRGV